MKKLTILAVLLVTAHTMHAANFWNWQAYLPSTESMQNFGMTCKQWISDNPKAAAIGGTLVGLGGLGYLGYQYLRQTQKPAEFSPTTTSSAASSTSTAHTPKEVVVAGDLEGFTQQLINAIKGQDLTEIEQHAMNFFNFQAVMIRNILDNPQVTVVEKLNLKNVLARPLDPIGDAINALSDEKIRTEIRKILVTASELALEKNGEKAAPDLAKDAHPYEIMHSYIDIDE